ncbi:two-component system, NtrC family, response regulator [Desulfonatronum thiosulfatophilum]|uniref:Two-component system, NtrC family, response regulator n=1 Tax=Desulfonatronum thiosulfatophilum TaxID=617002 RepID=A0A1G6ELE0_9BACT|nr:sigma-54 dependent transcriptional regulator [Desulfonatronum thiosulfatophilum]SDB58249.1 two-component system, NtrC family, response regulator [Desulfonatronum thiosulfatophilum]
MARVLIIDDDQIICSVLSKKIERLGHEVQYSHTISNGIEIAACTDFDVVFLDVRLPDGNGLDALPMINKGVMPPEVIIITGDSDPDGAELAIRSGAWDYIQKPSSLKSMVFPLIRALQYREKRKASSALKALKVNGIIGNSARIKACLDQVAHAADSELSVLITGETGTGKELFARAIHDNSDRAGARFVTVDCASLPENLVESELFGSIKGAFSGAVSNRDGLIMRANGGTLFLDEVGELPIAVQKKFLRVLQEHCFRKVGDNREIKSDFRLVCATNQDLEAMSENGEFRQDLHFRLKAMHVELPALRERKEDIKEIAMHHMNKICEHYRMPTKGMSPEFTEALLSYDWPGNVRELLNTLENVLVGSKDEPILYPQHLPINLRIKAKQASLNREPSMIDSPNQLNFQRFCPDDDDFLVDNNLPCDFDTAEVLRTSVEKPFRQTFSSSTSFPTLRELREVTISAMEKKYLEELLQRSGADLNSALNLSGLSRARFYELLKKHSMPFRMPSSNDLEETALFHTTNIHRNNEASVACAP